MKIVDVSNFRRNRDLLLFLFITPAFKVVDGEEKHESHYSFLKAVYKWFHFFLFYALNTI